MNVLSKQPSINYVMLEGGSGGFRSRYEGKRRGGELS